MANQPNHLWILPILLWSPLSETQRFQSFFNQVVSKYTTPSPPRGKIIAKTINPSTVCKRTFGIFQEMWFNALTEKKIVIPVMNSPITQCTKRPTYHDLFRYRLKKRRKNDKTHHPAQNHHPLILAVSLKSSTSVTWDFTNITPFAS